MLSDMKDELLRMTIEASVNGSISIFEYCSWGGKVLIYSDTYIKGKLVLRAQRTTKDK